MSEGGTNLTAQGHRSTLPETTALAHVATTGLNSEVNSTVKRYRGEDEYRNHRPGAERFVVLVKPQHMAKMGR